MKLTREVRFSLHREPPRAPITNSWGGWPSGGGVAPYLVVRATVAGEVDPVTGYLCTITAIDRVIRARAVPLVRRRWLESAGGELCCEGLLGDIRPGLAEALPEGVMLERLELQSTPFLSYSVRAGDPAMVSITQSFEFAAAHRLYCARLSDEENRATFGKCTNPNGHGHNYVLEVTVEGTPDPVTGVVVALPEFERTVKARVIDQLDHKHLNEDCAEFADLNPSVENITRVIWEKLMGQFGTARLACVRVFETPKTWAEYCGL